jgi:hypothetical protein
MKVETVCSYKTLIPTCQTTQCQSVNLEDGRCSLHRNVLTYITALPMPLTYPVSEVMELPNALVICSAERSESKQHLGVEPDLLQPNHEYLSKPATQTWRQVAEQRAQWRALVLAVLHACSCRSARVQLAVSSSRVLGFGCSGYSGYGSGSEAST